MRSLKSLSDMHAPYVSALTATFKSTTNSQRPCVIVYQNGRITPLNAPVLKQFTNDHDVIGLLHSFWATSWSTVPEINVAPLATNIHICYLLSQELWPGVPVYDLSVGDGVMRVTRYRPAVASVEPVPDDSEPAIAAP